MEILTCMKTDSMAEMLGGVVVVGGSAAFEGFRACEEATHGKKYVPVLNLPRSYNTTSV